MRTAFTASLCVFALAAVKLSLTIADGPADNIPANVRRMPKLGVEVPAEKRAELETQLAAFDREIKDIAGKRKDTATLALLPDVLIYYKAAHDALKYQEFHAEKEIDVAFELIKEGRERAASLAEGKPTWTEQTGLVVRGYVSKIDGSVQPYGLVIPESYSRRGPRVRLDFWFHGRGETLSELNFIQQRRKSVGQFAPADTIVLHPYGRWNNANKFAGEVDGFEALDAVKKHYRIDMDRIAVRGFSMGGAAAWHFAVHHADQWFAANPGAGFSETPDFLKVFQQETLKPTWWEEKLWHMYDCTDYAINLSNVPTVAYSGEVDKQKQAADIMAVALEKEGMTLTHIIGPKTPHKYETEAAKEVERRMDSLAAIGRDAMRWKVDLVTYTLKYNRMYWITIDEMDEHWEQARITADFSTEYEEVNRNELFEVSTKGVAAFTIDLKPGQLYMDVRNKVKVRIDKQDITGLAIGTDRSFQASFHRVGTQWKLGARPREAGLVRKKHDLQGPIDDAFMDSFIFVRPTGKARNERVEKWAKEELERGIEQWRRHFRGEARVKDDTAITDADIAGANLVLWGDPESNAVMKRIADKLPIRWTEQAIAVGGSNYNPADHALIAIHPNPLNAERYVVLNSGFTFREYAHLNNARQVPMLPDWAVVDLKTPPNSVWPGKVVNAGFFDETWRVKSK
ncbi:MAG: prolyl oligopeptidase family serine peptidase [Phycisphaeraceae bacterium]